MLFRPLFEPRQRLRALRVSRRGAGAIVVLAVLASVAGSGATSSSAASASSFPTPPLGATVYSRELGPNVLALALVPNGRRIELEADVVGPQGLGVKGLTISLRLDAARKRATMVAPGRYAADFSPGRPPRSADVLVGATGLRWHVALPAAWPPRGAAAIVAHAGRVWRSLHSLSFRESLASNPRNALISQWRLQAPDRLAYRIENGWAGVVIGGRRWDRAPHATRWQASAQTRLRQPLPTWVSVQDAHVLGVGVVRGRPIVRVSFFDPAAKSWFALTIDRKTFRTFESRMITSAHFMYDTYRAFNSTSPIVPPA